jgi:hypothetical protein
MFITFKKYSVDINVSIIVKPYWLADISFMEHALHETKQKLEDRPVNIYALVETPIALQPYRTVIDLIVDHLQISPAKILVHTRDPDFYHAGVTKVPYNIWNEDIRQLLNTDLLSLDLIQPGADSKKFGALYGRIQLGRILLAYHLERFHGEHSIVSFLAEPEFLQHEIFSIEKFFEDINLWWHSRNNPTESSTPHQSFGEYNIPENITTYPRMAKLFQIEIVCETQCSHRGDFTEKTWRCLASGKPFVLLSGPGNVKLLRDLGFETYHPWIDESYDQIPDLMGRITAIRTEIDRLASLDQAQWQLTIDALNEIARRNREFYRAWKPLVSLP